MLKTRITEQYGLNVPFINAGMAFIATAPLAQAVCEAGGMGMLGAAAMPPDVLQEAIRGIKAVNPAWFGGVLDQTSFGVVTCQQFRLVVGNLAKLGFEGLGDAGVKRASRLPQ